MWSGEPAQGRLSLRIGALALGLASAGCAIDDRGLLQSRVTPVDGGWIHEIRVIGAHLRTAGDPGLTLGYSLQRTLHEGPPPAAAPSGWWNSGITTAATPAVLRHHQSAGIVLQAGTFVGVVAGYENHIVIETPEGARSVLGVRYLPGAPGESFVTFCSGEPSC